MLKGPCGTRVYATVERSGAAVEVALVRMAALEGATLASAKAAMAHAPKQSGEGKKEKKEAPKAAEGGDKAAAGEGGEKKMTKGEQKAAAYAAKMAARAAKEAEEAEKKKNAPVKEKKERKVRVRVRVCVRVRVRVCFHCQGLGFRVWGFGWQSRRRRRGRCATVIHHGLWVWGLGFGVWDGCHWNKGREGHGGLFPSESLRGASHGEEGESLLSCYVDTRLRMY
jgi:hypothetical protein